MKASCPWRSLLTADSRSSTRIAADHADSHLHIEQQRGTSCNPASAKHLYNICKMLVKRLRSWYNVVQMLYRWFVLARKVLMSVTMHSEVQSKIGSM